MTLNILERQKQQIDSNVSLGRLMWYSVSDDTMVDHKYVVKELTLAGLGSTIPALPRDHNVFRRVTTDAQRKTNAANSIVENWMVRDVAGRNEDIITRRIVMEERDGKNRKLSYQQISDVEFDRTTGAIRFRWLQQEDGTWFDTNSAPTAHAMMSDITSEFHRWRGNLNHYAIREWIRTTILEMGATAARASGGVYFLPEDRADKVEALELFVSGLPGGSECHSLPLVDNEKQRKMVRKAIEADTNDAIDHLLSDIREIKQQGRLTPNRFASLIGEAKRLANRTKDYAGLLEQELKEMDSRLEILRRQTFSLSGLQRTRGSHD